MGITFQAAIDRNTLAKQMVFVKDLYPGLEDEYFNDDPYVKRDEVTGLLYEMREVCDFVYEHDFSYDRFYAVLEAVDHNLVVLTQQDACYSISHADIPAFKRKIIKALNSSKTESHAYETVQIKNFIHCGMNKDEIIARLEIMLEITTNAQERELDVYWA